MTETVRVSPMGILWHILDQRPEAEEWQLVSVASHELRTPLTALRADVDVDDVGFVLVRHVPGSLKQVVAGQDLPWPPHEDLKQLELLGRQRDRRAPSPDDL